VPCDEGGERVTDGEAQRVIPRRDEADDANGAALLPGDGEERDRAAAATGPEVAPTVTGVVPRDEGDVSDLLEGVPPRLPGFPLDEVLGEFGVLEDEVVEAEEDAGAFAERARGPRGLCPARSAHGLAHVDRRRERD